MQLTIYNHQLRTSARVRVPADGVLSRRQAELCRRKLGTPPGFDGAGPLGEVGEQRPPEVPGHRFETVLLHDGEVKLVPHQLEKPARKRA